MRGKVFSVDSSADTDVENKVSTAKESGASLGKWLIAIVCLFDLLGRDE
jgi:hypothetical protein